MFNRRTCPNRLSRIHLEEYRLTSPLGSILGVDASQNDHIFAAVMTLRSALTLLGKSAYVALVVVIMVALGAAGADAARRTDAESKHLNKKTTVAVSENPQVGPAPAPETPGGSMTPNSRPTTEQQAVLSAVTAPTSHDRLSDSPEDNSVLAADIPSPSRGACRGGSPRSSLATASPRSAALSTLVGAVPSGTM